MDFAPSPKQALVLWRLLFTGERPKQSEVRPALTPRERAELERAGLIEREKRGRALHLVPTDHAWAWALAHLDAPVHKVLSPATGIVLHAVLARLKVYLSARSLGVAELFIAPDAADSESEAAKHDAALPLDQRIRAAYLEASGGRWSERVRLVRLRAHLDGLERTDIDAALLDLQNRDQLVLLTLDNPAERRPEDEAAAVTVAGAKRHIVYMGR